MVTNIIIVNSPDREVADLAASSGLQVAGTWTLAELAHRTQQAGSPPELLLVDIRSLSGVPREIEAFKHRHPTTSVMVIARKLDVDLMRDAMRMGVGECLAEPVTAPDLRSAVDRMLGDNTGGAVAKVFAFWGAKGGVGTTTLAVNVAAALAAAPEHPAVMLLDLHTQGPGDAALFFGIEPRYSIIDALDNLHRLDGAFVRGLVTRAACGVDVIPAAVQAQATPPAAHAVHTLLRWLVRHYDFVVLDMPHLGVGANLLDSIEQVTVATLIVTQELTTIRRGTPMALMLRNRYGKARVNLVVNRYDSRAEIAREDFERVLGLPVAAMLPSDYSVALVAANSGQPIVTSRHSKLSGALVALAERLRATPAADTAEGPHTQVLGGASAGLM